MAILLNLVKSKRNKENTNEINNGTKLVPIVVTVQTCLYVILGVMVVQFCSADKSKANDGSHEIIN